MKKILIITYYWPPSGGAGVHRWLGFVKYLNLKGYKPIIYTPENPDSSVEDISLLNSVAPDIEVIKRPIWEPYGYYKKLLRQKKGEKINTGFISEKKKPSRMENFAVWVRGNFFIPDARKFWIKPSIKYLSSIIKEKNIDIVISTGPPHSMHLIALGLKKRFTIKWIADFRDPWTNIDFYDQLKLTKASDKKHRELENKVLEKADLCIAIGKTLGNELKSLGAKNVEVITNGFDGEIIQSKPNHGKFSIGHFGSFSSTRNPKYLWKVLAGIGKELPGFLNDLEIELVGKVDHTIFSSLHENGLDSNTIKYGQVSYAEAQEKMETCQVLLLVANDTPNAKGILTSKLFEYMRVSRPVLAMGPEESDMSDVMKEVYSNSAINYNDELSIKNKILDFYSDYKKGNLVVDSDKTMAYHRENLTEKLIEQIELLSSAD